MSAVFKKAIFYTDMKYVIWICRHLEILLKIQWDRIGPVADKDDSLKYKN